MGVILDSCIWIGLSTRQFTFSTVVAATQNASLTTSVITLGELHFGVQSCADPAMRAIRSAYLQRIEAGPILQLTPLSAAAFGILSASEKRSGRSPRPRYNDLWIAAQAIEHGFTLLTLNANDFRNLPGVKLIVLSPVSLDTFA